MTFLQRKNAYLGVSRSEA